MAELQYNTADITQPPRHLAPPPPPPPARPTATSDVDVAVAAAHSAAASGLLQPQLQRQRAGRGGSAAAGIQLPTITTSIAAAQARSSSSPYSCSSHSPYTPSNLSSGSLSATTTAATRTMSASVHNTPVMAYNPQQWSRAANVGGSFMPHQGPSNVAPRQRGELTGMEASMPSPPPPYSPVPPSANMSPIVRGSPATHGSAFAPATRGSPSANVDVSAFSGLGQGGSPVAMPPYGRTHSGGSANTQSPVPVQAPSFPPPPGVRGGREASESRSRSDRHLFSFANLTSRNRNADSASQQSAIDSLRHNTSQMLSQAPTQSLYTATASNQPMTHQDEMELGSPTSPRPPASRRAASTGAIGLPQNQGWDRNQSQMSSSNLPPPGTAITLPPPPPGPPPGGIRSQSMGRPPNVLPPPRHHQPNASGAAPPVRPNHFGMSLGPIPPTPAGWTEEQDRQRSRSPAARGLQIDTGQGDASRMEPSTVRQMPSEIQTAHPSTDRGLQRTPAKRDPSARGIRERRSESRAERDRMREVQSAHPRTQQARPFEAESESSPPMPTDLVLPTQASNLAQRRVANQRSPASGEGMRSPPLTGGSGISSRLLDDRLGHESSHSTPRQDGTKNDPAESCRGVLTSATSLDGALKASKHVDTTSPALMNKPNAVLPTEQESFALASIERFKTFAGQESAATSDRERLELFAAFMVSESRIRRDRYSQAFDSVAGEIFDLSRDMWKSHNAGGRQSATPNAALATTPATAPPVESWRSQSSVTDQSEIFSPTTAGFGPDVSGANYTPVSETESPSSATALSRPPRGDTLLTGFQPCLSPIPSMAMSTVPDDQEGSRGRTASRWWEASAEGGSTGAGGKKLERSKKESKYMGLPRDQWDTDQAADGNAPGPSQSGALYGPNEYPPEKGGSHSAGGLPSGVSLEAAFYGSISSNSPTPNPFRLDVSRLVTLPPPYPRHYPAVNNNHPELAPIRANLRALGENDESSPIKEAFQQRVNENREREQARAEESRTALRSSIRERVRTESMSFADAAKVEADFEANEVARAKHQAQEEFDGFQKEVVNPLHAMFSERITKATASMDQVQSGLYTNAKDPGPNQTQEGGDEQPELQERLTLLKWLFENREQQYRSLFELEGERNEYYKNLILTPYRLSGSEDKIREVEQFFTKDDEDRQLKSKTEILARFEKVMATIEQNVTRGVEDQLSAFWDIAPGLLGVIQKVPADLEGFEVEIPAQEFEENPAYYSHPLQYLYSLMLHAEKSAYQFIESQTNLLCLLHEVKSGVMAASSRLLQTQRCLAGEDYRAVDEEMEGVMRHEERRLTEDLKEKVGLVESQWGEALGKGLAECKDRVQVFLEEKGGWDESLKE